MKYLVTYIEKGKRESFYTNWFDSDNHFNSDMNMVVFDLDNHLFTSDGKVWLEIEEDHL